MICSGDANELTRQVSVHDALSRDDPLIFDGKRRVEVEYDVGDEEEGDPNLHVPHVAHCFCREADSEGNNDGRVEDEDEDTEIPRFLPSRLRVDDSCACFIPFVFSHEFVIFQMIPSCIHPSVCP